jgi:hypothetical protein
MNNNEALIRKFYTAFQQGDFLAMQSCYHPGATFSDPVFQNLDSAEVKSMWEMLLRSSKDLKVEFSDVTENSARWDAWYTFSRSGRPVHNIVRSHFTFCDGLIFNQKDDFNFWRWSHQALGLSGTLLGWTPVVSNKVRTLARKNLDDFRRKSK